MIAHVILFYAYLLLGLGLGMLGIYLWFRRG